MVTRSSLTLSGSIVEDGPHQTQRQNHSFCELSSLRLYAQLLTRHPYTLHPIRNFLKRNLPRKIRPLMLRLHINTKRAKTTIIRRPQLTLINPLRRLHHLLTYLLRRLNSRIQGVDDAHKSDLLDAVRVFADRLPDLLVDGGFVLLGRELDEEVAGVHGEKGGEEGAVGDFARVHAVAVAAGTGVDADVFALFCGETVEDSGAGLVLEDVNDNIVPALVVEVDECLEEFGACPWVSRIFLGGKSAWERCQFK